MNRLQIRRDRRKAKQSGYRREPKPMGSKVGHGTSGGSGGPKRVMMTNSRPVLVEIAPIRPEIQFGALASLGEILAYKRIKIVLGE